MTNKLSSPFEIKQLPRLIYAVITIILILYTIISIYIFEQRKQTTKRVEIISEYHLPSMAALNELLIEINLIKSYITQSNPNNTDPNIHTTKKDIEQNIYLARENLNKLFILHEKYNVDLFSPLINRIKENPINVIADLQLDSESPNFSFSLENLNTLKITILQLRRLHLQQSSHTALKLSLNSKNKTQNIAIVAAIIFIIGSIIIGIIILIIKRTIHLQHHYALELEKHRENLEDLVDDRTEELQTANKEMEAFCYSISHDLRSPLRAMNAYSQFLIEDHKKELNEDANHYLDRIRENSIRMAELIDALLGLSKLGKYDIKHQPVEMNKICQEALENAHDLYPDQPIEFKCKIKSNVLGDANLLRLVLENLFSNAIKYSSSREKSIISVTEERLKGKTVFCVSDNGVGFEMKYANKVFGIFQQLHRITEYEGTGIGLATTSRIIQRHGGQVWAESEPDKGAMFCFSLSSDENNSEEELPDI